MEETEPEIRVEEPTILQILAQKLGYGGKAGTLAMVIERGYGRRCVYPITLS